MRFFAAALSLLALASSVQAHLGIQTPVVDGVRQGKIRDTLVMGDQWRYPNTGYCSSNVDGRAATNQGVQATLAAGTTYRFMMNDAPAAPHGGGHCSFMVTPDNGKTFYKIDDVAHCTCAPGDAGGTLNSGCAQNLNSGSNRAYHDLTIPKNMPAVCGTTGCTLVWFWTPTFSGACEIYSDCYDVKITGATAGQPSSVVLNGYPSQCAYPGSNGMTTNYGAIIGPSKGDQGSSGGGDGNNGGGSGGGGSSGTTGGPLRCGKGWADANSKCGVGCPGGTDAPCPTGEQCFKDLDASKCSSGGGGGGGTSPTTAPTKAPTPPNNAPCQGVGLYKNVPGIIAWCNNNCIKFNFCPSNVCSCTYTTPQATWVSEYVQDTQPYTPVCKGVKADGVKSAAQLLALFDNTDPAVYPDEEARFAVFFAEFSKLNVAVLPDATATTQQKVVPAGTILKVPGDCSMVDASKQPDAANVYDATTKVNGASAAATTSLLAVATAAVAAVARRLL